MPQLVQFITNHSAALTEQGLNPDALKTKLNACSTNVHAALRHGGGAGLRPLVKFTGEFAGNARPELFSSLPESNRQSHENISTRRD